MNTVTKRVCLIHLSRNIGPEAGLTILESWAQATRILGFLVEIDDSHSEENPDSIRPKVTISIPDSPAVEPTADGLKL